MKRVMICAAMIVSIVMGIGQPAAAGLIGPSGGSGLTGEYASFSDSPFSGGSFTYFYLEDFEDHLLNTPGVTASAGAVASTVSPSFHDSVDLDDGVLNGSGLAGDSFFTGSGAAGITFTFNEGVLGVLPTHAGIVWTDGAGTTSFEAFDSNGNSLGIVGPVSLNDGSINGTTTDDRFFGITSLGGISAIKISNSLAGMEVDHLQYGHFASSAVPEPASLTLLSMGAAGLVIGAIRRRHLRKSGT